VNFQLNGLAVWLYRAVNPSRMAESCSRLSKSFGVTTFFWMTEKKISIWFSHEACSGVWIMIAFGCALASRVMAAWPRWSEPLCRVGCPARSPAWEFLYFAGQLLHERNSVEAKYRDHEIHYASAVGEIVRRADIASYISRKASDASRLASKITRLISDRATQERAFGAPGQAGDPDRIGHLAARWNSTYEEFMDWAASLRGASVPSEYDNLLELLARYADGPVEQYRTFVDEFVAKVDKVPAALIAGDEVHLEMTLVVSIADDVKEVYEAEFDRLMKRLEQDTTGER
jgi:hypothetical protein